MDVEMAEGEGLYRRIGKDVTFQKEDNLLGICSFIIQTYRDQNEKMR